MKTLHELFTADPDDPKTWEDPYELNVILGLKPWMPTCVDVWFNPAPKPDPTWGYTMHYPEVRALLEKLHDEWKKETHRG